MTAPEALRRRARQLARIRIALNMPNSATQQMSLLEAIQLLGQLRMQGKLPAAWALADALIADGRAATEARLVKLGLCMDLQRLREARQLIDELADVKLRDPGGIQTLALAMRSLGMAADARRLLDFGLAQMPNDPALLEIHQPVYTRAVNAWEAYRRHLEPARRVLEAAG